MDLRLRTVREQNESDGVATVELGGELELHNAHLLREELNNLCAGERPGVVVDLTHLSFMDSTGIGVLVNGFKAARSHSGALALVCPSQRLMRLFEIAGLTSALVIFGDRADAQAYVRQTLAKADAKTDLGSNRPAPSAS